MRVQGRIEIGPYGGTSKSARQHQAFLVTPGGERLQLRRYDGPPMRDAVLEAMAGQEVVADGLRRDRLFIAKALAPAPADAAPAVRARGAATAPASGTASSASGGRAKRRS